MEKESGVYFELFSLILVRINNIKQNLNYSLISINMEEQKVKSLVVEALSRKCRKWEKKREKFQTYLINLEQSRDLWSFIGEIYDHKGELGMDTEEIKDLLIEFGNSDTLKREFGWDLYKLWFQFEILDEADLQKRIDEKIFDRFPKTEKGQPDLLKAMYQQNVPSFINGDEVKLIKSIQSKPLYKDFMAFLKMESSVVSIPSKIVKSSRIRQSMSKLKQHDRMSCALKLLKNLVDTIGVLDKIDDPDAVLENLKIFIDQVLEKNEIQSELLRNDLQQIIFHTLSINVKMNSCFVQDKMTDTIKTSFMYFKKFYECQYKLKQIQLGNETMNDFLQFFEKIVPHHNAIWNWPVLDGDSLILFLRNKCLNDKALGKYFLEILERQPPNLKSHIFNQRKRAFLEEALMEMPPLSEKGKYGRLLMTLTQKQEIDIENPLDNNETFLQMFKNLGIPAQHLSRLESKIEDNQRRFYIFDIRTKEKVPLYFGKDQTCELMDRISNPHQYHNGCMQHALFEFFFTISSEKMSGYYRPTAFNKHCPVQCEGPLFYGEFMEFGTRVKQFKWTLLTDEGKEQTLKPSENDKIRNQIYKINVTREQNPFFRCKIGQNEQIIEVNARTLEVRALVQTSKVNTSQMKVPLGVLIFAPSYKGQMKIEDPTEDEIQPYFDMNSPVEQKNMRKRQSYQTDKESEDSEEEKIIRSEVVFKFFGVFKNYFSIEEGYRFGQKFNVYASQKKSIDYFKNFQKKQMYEFMKKFTLQKPSAKVKLQFSNRFKLMKKAKQKAEQKMRNFASIFKKQFTTSYDDKNQMILVENMVNTEDGNKFFKALFEYCHLEWEEEEEKKSYVLKMTKDQINYLQASKMPGVVMKHKGEKEVQIECNKENKKKLEKQLETLDQITQFTFQNPEILEAIKKMEPQYIEDIDLKQIDRTNETFKVSYKLKYHPKFKQKYQHYWEMEAEKPSEMISKLIEKDAELLHIYRSEMDKVDRQISVSKMGEDILLQYNSKLEKHVKNALVKIQQLIQKQLFNIAKNSGKEFQIQGISFLILDKLRKKLEELLKSVSGKGVVQAKIVIEPKTQTLFFLKGIQMNANQEKMMEKWMDMFQKSFKSFKKCKFEIFDTQKYFSKAFSKLPKNQSYKKKLGDLNHDFKTLLRAELLQKIEEVTKENEKLLQNQFSEYLVKSKLDKEFSSQLTEKCSKELQKGMESLNIFEKFLLSKIEEFENASNIKKATIKATVLAEKKQNIEELESRFKASKLESSHMKRYFKSVNILLTIYYGPQLPITDHLQNFRQILNQNDVVMVKVGTGSGKSTVIPPYLVGLGYKKVVVTQPRRLPCRQIYKRICNIFGEGVSGYEVGDGKSDEKNSLLYTTDGLLKMKAIFREEVFDQIDVLVIDEIHERSINIDVLLLVIASYYAKKKRKMKLILCSATIDENIGKIMSDSGLKIDIFEPNIPSRFTVTDHPIKEGTLIEKIVELSHRVNHDEQILAFFPGVNEVYNTVKILKQKYNRIAFPITANMTHKEQDKILANGQIFISTSIAETSLTFKKLRFVIDSRLSRWRVFDPELQLMKTEEDYSSNSSLKQRRGRVGRTCNGEYHFYEYQDYDFSNNRDHNPTELEKNDFTNVIFELLLRQDSKISQIISLLEKLNHNADEFSKKIKYTRSILLDSAIMKSDGSLFNNARKLLNFGNLGNPLHNSALFAASENNCLMNVAYLVSFLMFGSIVSGQFVNYCKLKYKKGGDLRVVHDFLLEIGEKINLVAVKENQIYYEMNQKCSYDLKGKPFFNLLVKIMIKTKQLLTANNNNVPAPSSQWDKIMQIFKGAYKNRLFFNRSLFGGNKTKYEKIRSKVEFNYEQKNEDSAVTFAIDHTSLLYNKAGNDMPKIMIALNSNISPLGECILSLCEEIPLEKIYTPVQVLISGATCKNQFFQGNQSLKEEDIFRDITNQVNNKSKNIKVTNNFPKMKLEGFINEISTAFAKIVEPKRRNEEIKINLKKIHEIGINEYQRRLQWNKMLPKIEPEHSRVLLQKLSFEDYKGMFSNLKYEMLNDFDVEMEWDVKQSKISVKKAKNIHLNKIVQKLQNCFKWFSECQVISKEEYKIKPYFIGDFYKTSKESLPKIMKRVNQIVDSSLDFYILKGWVSGSGPNTKFPRTARMIAACWVLTCKFHCVIKGGFVRDWVVNGEEVVPPMKNDRVNLLQKNPRNPFKEVIDDSVTPSDIDAEISSGHLFDGELFKKEMKKLGINIVIEDGGWRKHILFDDKTQSGGFTADLIEPYTSITHYTYDFDVNVMYIKRNHMNSIGMKIPLEYENGKTHSIKRVDLDELMSLCNNKEMFALKDWIPEYRFTKFKQRKWKIKNDPNIQPVCYKSFFTQSFPRKPEDIKDIDPEFYQKMVVTNKFKVNRIEQLKNRGWDDGFESVQHWIISEQQKGKRGQNDYIPNKINSNNKVLYHGTSAIGAKGIKESGFDSRFYAPKGYYGRGAYFAQDPMKSHGYTGQGPVRYMFFVNVALGNQQNLTQAANDKAGPSKGYHSLYGTAGSAKQYIIDRWGQAKPLYLVEYEK